MTGRDQRDHWTERLECPKCGKTSFVKLSQANGRAFHEEICVDLVPIGFRVVLTEFGNSFYCASCGTSADHK